MLLHLHHDSVSHGSGSHKPVVRTHYLNLERRQRQMMQMLMFSPLGVSIADR